MAVNFNTLFPASFSVNTQCAVKKEGDYYFAGFNNTMKTFPIPCYDTNNSKSVILCSKSLTSGWQLVTSKLGSYYSKIWDISYVGGKYLIYYAYIQGSGYTPVTTIYKCDDIGGDVTSVAKPGEDSSDSRCVKIGDSVFYVISAPYTSSSEYIYQIDKNLNVNSITLNDASGMQLKSLDFSDAFISAAFADTRNYKGYRYTALRQLPTITFDGAAAYIKAK